MRRAEERASRVGRSVPPAFIKQAYSNIDRNVLRIMREADNFHMYDAHNGFRKTFEKVEGVEHVHDVDHHRKFMEGRS